MRYGYPGNIAGVADEADDEDDGATGRPSNASIAAAPRRCGGATTTGATGGISMVVGIVDVDADDDKRMGDDGSKSLDPQSSSSTGVGLLWLAVYC